MKWLVVFIIATLLVGAVMAEEAPRWVANNLNGGNALAFYNADSGDPGDEGASPSLVQITAFADTVWVSDWNYTASTEAWASMLVRTDGSGKTARDSTYMVLPNETVALTYDSSSKPELVFVTTASACRVWAH